MVSPIDFNRVTLRITARVCYSDGFVQEGFCEFCDIFRSGPRSALHLRNYVSIRVFEPIPIDNRHPTAVVRIVWRDEKLVCLRLLFFNSITFLLFSSRFQKCAQVVPGLRGRNWIAKRCGANALVLCERGESCFDYVTTSFCLFHYLKFIVETTSYSEIIASCPKRTEPYDGNQNRFYI